MQRSITEFDFLTDLPTFPLFGIALFGFGSLLSIIAASAARSTQRKSNCTILLALNFVSAIGNAATLFGPQQNVNIIKYGQWALTFPLITTLLGNITNNQRGSRMTYNYFLAYLTCQFICNTSRDPLSTYTLFLGLYFYYKFIMGTEKMFSNVVASSLNKPLRIVLRKVVRCSFGLCKSSHLM